MGSVRKLLQGKGSSPAIDTLQTLEEDTELTQEEFKQLLETIDSGLRALPATAQVCAVIITRESKMCPFAFISCVARTVRWQQCSRPFLQLQWCCFSVCCRHVQQWHTWAIRCAAAATSTCRWPRHRMPQVMF